MKNDYVKGGEILNTAKSKLVLSEQLGEVESLTFSAQEFVSIISVLANCSHVQSKPNLTVIFTKNMGLFFLLEKIHSPEMIVFQLKSLVV